MGHRHLFVIGTVLLLLFSVVLRYVLVPFESYDYVVYLRDWFYQLKDAGSIMEGMRREIGNYNHLYRFLLSLLTWMPPIWAVKMLSMLFDYVGAAAVAYLGYAALLQSGTEKRHAAATACIAGLILLYSPIVLMNSAVWGTVRFYVCFFLDFLSCLFGKEKVCSRFFVLWSGVQLEIAVHFSFANPYFTLCSDKTIFAYIFFANSCHSIGNRGTGDHCTLAGIRSACFAGAVFDLQKPDR